MEVRSFLLNTTPNPELGQGVTDPQQLLLLYGQVGREVLPNPGDAEARAELASTYYAELSAADYERYRSVLTRSSSMKKYAASRAVPPSAAILKKVASATKLFDEVNVLSHPETGEAMLVGITSGDALRYFKIVQWGDSLTTIEMLRRKKPREKRRNLKKTFGRPHGTPYLILVALAAAGIAWTLFTLAVVGWWAFLGLLVALLVLSIRYAFKTERRTAASGELVMVISGINIVAALIAGGVHLNDLNTQESTREVLICKADHDSLEISPKWYVLTDQGKIMLDPGFYEGKFHSEASEELANSLVGKWATVRVHGGQGPAEVYMNQAENTRPGSCG